MQNLCRIIMLSVCVWQSYPCFLLVRRVCPWLPLAGGFANLCRFFCHYQLIAASDTVVTKPAARQKTTP
jgi:hypothetical protein